MCSAEVLKLRKQGPNGVRVGSENLSQGKLYPTSNSTNGSVRSCPDQFRTSTSYGLFHITTYVAVTVAMKEFSVFLPQVMSEAGRKTFLHAAYQFDTINTYFDNTAWTWGTDYILSILMTYGAFKCLFATKSDTGESNRDATRPIRLHAFALLVGYAISVFSGAVAHQHYTTLESLNTTSFRVLWTVCVGNVTFATAFMGMVGADICRKINQNANKDQILFRVPIIPTWAWLLYGCYMTYFCWCGDLSCKRPACDIFIAGITQLIPTLYCEVVLLSRKWSDACFFEMRSTTPRDRVADGIKAKYRSMFYVGFILNSPLLFLYPLAVQYTPLSLGIINALLHLNLCFAWGMQGVSLHHIAKALNRLPKNC